MQQNQAALFVPIPCPRCGELCKVSSSTGDPRFMKRATKPSPKAMCATCAVTAFIKSVETFHHGIELNGVQMFLNPMVQEQFGKLLQGFGDATPGEIDWQRLVDNWELPVPGERGFGK